MSIKSTIAAAASPFLFAGAAFAGPYVNLEATGSYPDGAYTSGALEAVVGYEGATESGIGWYVSGGPTVTHTETAATAKSDLIIFVFSFSQGKTPADGKSFDIKILTSRRGTIFRSLCYVIVYSIP